MGRILAIDLGTKKTGIALSDPFRIIAKAWDTFKHEASNYDKLIDYLIELIKNKNVDLIVLGFPLNSDKTETNMSKIVSKFKIKLEKKINLKIILTNEFKSSKEADERIKKLKIKLNEKITRDSLAAQIILEDFLFFSEN